VTPQQHPNLEQRLCTLCEKPLFVDKQLIAAGIGVFHLTCYAESFPYPEKDSFNEVLHDEMDPELKYSLLKDYLTPEEQVLFVIRYNAARMAKHAYNPQYHQAREKLADEQRAAHRGT